MTFNPQPRANFPDAAAHASALVCLAQLTRFRVVRQAVRKQFIRESLLRRFGILYGLFGFVTVPLWCLFFVVGVAWLMDHPGVAVSLIQGCSTRGTAAFIGALWLTRFIK